MSVNLFAVTFDCADAAGLATFWSGVLERPVEDGATAEMASIAPKDAASRKTGARTGTSCRCRKARRPRTGCTRT